MAADAAPISNATELSKSSILCLSCGLCCDGTLFAHANLIPEDDDARLQANGFVVFMNKDKRAFRLGCHHHQERRCTLYQSWRPDVCGSFKCKLLQRMERDEISLEQARATVDEALDHSAQVRAQLDALPGVTYQNVISAYAKGKKAEQPDTLPEGFNQAVLNYLALQIRFDRFFRPPRAAAENPAKDLPTNAYDNLKSDGRIK